MHSKSYNIEIMINDDGDQAIKELLDSLKIDIKIIYSERKVAILSLIIFFYCIKNVMK